MVRILINKRFYLWFGLLFLPIIAGLFFFIFNISVFFTDGVASYRQIDSCLNLLPEDAARLRHEVLLLASKGDLNGKLLMKEEMSEDMTILRGLSDKYKIGFRLYEACRGMTNIEVNLSGGFIRGGYIICPLEGNPNIFSAQGAKTGVSGGNIRSLGDGVWRYLE